MWSSGLSLASSFASRLNKLRFMPLHFRCERQFDCAQQKTPPLSAPGANSQSTISPIAHLRARVKRRFTAASEIYRNLQDGRKIFSQLTVFLFRNPAE